MSIVLENSWAVKKRAVEAAKRIAGNPRAYRVKRGHSCPICGHRGTAYCCYDPLSGVALCPRKANGALLNRDGRPIRFGNFGYLHVHDLSRLSIGELPAQPVASKPTSGHDAATLTRIATMYADCGRQAVGDAASDLGLPATALNDFGLGRFNFHFGDVGQTCDCWTWTERAATGEVCGIGYRRRGDGEKRARGHRGIVMTTAFATDRNALRAAAIAKGYLVLAEGFTDAVTAHAMGAIAIGRPSVSGGMAEVVSLLTSLDLPERFLILVCGENDQKPDGKWPGRDEAGEFARKLQDQIGPRLRVYLVMPPNGTKDLRGAWHAGMKTWNDFAERADFYDASQIRCEPTANHSVCPDSCVQNGNPVRMKRDKAAFPQHIRDQWATNPWDCPSVIGVAGRKDHSPALLPGVCRKRSCPVCGPHWKLVTFTRFHFHITGHDGQLYADTIPDVDWQATIKDMRRRAKGLGVHLRYVAIRDEDDRLTVISSVHVLPGLARPVEKPEALEILEKAIDVAAKGPRPVGSCRAWGPIEEEDKNDIERIPGGCSPAIFRKTVAAWGTKAETSGTVFACRPGLFLDSRGQFDADAETDFWYECQTRFFDGDEAADSYRLVAAERRAARSAGPPDVPSAACQHDQIEIETPTFDGYVNLSCGACGAPLGCRKAGAA